MPASDRPTPVPDLGSFMAEDTGEGTPRLGRVTAWDGSVVHLRPPGGGTTWTAAPGRLRRPTEGEAALIRVLTTPVPATSRPPGTCPEPPVVLSVEPLPPAVPTAGCPICELVAAWEQSSLRRHDYSKAADFRVEMRNHPHTEPKLRMPEVRRPRELP
ncbi:hypothetical protein [Streptomyces hydrogenans]|uniref:Uncharacterized protein n=1 Tax=Streptomyces hydrogenans TaxID=1873719 RepID=A0ABQ3PMY1_9ACTN|nr:hypothetical protein [Streptomyces hydrogenans]GHI26378.1 hypothetical protein Shyd_77490 [Streptomyces hydrogenans]